MILRSGIIRLTFSQQHDANYLLQYQRYIFIYSYFPRGKADIAKLGQNWPITILGDLLFSRYKS